METNFENQFTPKEENKSFSGLNPIATKVILIGVLILLLLIPMSMIQGLIEERKTTAENATLEVQLKFSTEQTIYSPIITLPFCNDTVKKTNDIAHILPKTLKISGNIKTEELKRGIYEVVVYNGPIEIEGTFSIPEEINDFENVDFKKAQIKMGISDLHGIKEQAIINLGDSTYKLKSGVQNCHLFNSGISSPIELTADTHEIKFKTTLKLKGSSNLSFVPLGETTEVKLTSNCTTPSFMGSYLPEERKVTDNGFEASWKILDLNRNYPQLMINDINNENVKSSSFGVNVLTPIQHYQKCTRSVKYAILIIVLTFVVNFFVEMLLKKKIHPLQYLLIGLALCLFYALLISLSEHIGFTPAYGTAAAMTTVLLTLYIGGILKVWKMAAIIGILLFALYFYIFILIQMETYALLAGSIGSFVILAVIMFVSQKINWSLLKVGSINS